MDRVRVRVLEDGLVEVRGPVSQGILRVLNPQALLDDLLKTSPRERNYTGYPWCHDNKRRNIS